jgi:hypothetical protein
MTRGLLSRRAFLEHLATVAALIRNQASRVREISADLVIVGGGSAGAPRRWPPRSGLRVVMTEETDWVGGQLTSQAVPLDENAWIESTGGTGSYRQLRRRIREYYARNYPLTAAARANPRLNPGNGNVSRLCHEPRVGLAALEEMLAPHLASRRLDLLLRHAALDADTDGDRVKAVCGRRSSSTPQNWATCYR